MIEQTLAQVGIFLSEQLEVPMSHVLYEEKEGLLRRLSEEGKSIKFPAVTYSISDVTPFTQKTSTFNATSSLDANIGKKFIIIPLKLTITLCHFATDYKHDIALISKYFLFNIFSEATVDFKLPDGTKLPMDVSISELQPLTTPPSMGREAFDFERGKYYIKEGGFSIPSFIFIPREDKRIRVVQNTTDFIQN